MRASRVRGHAEHVTHPGDEFISSTTSARLQPWRPSACASRTIARAISAPILAIVGDPEVHAPLRAGADERGGMLAAAGGVGRDVGLARLRQLGGRAQGRRHAGRQRSACSTPGARSSPNSAKSPRWAGFSPSGPRPGACGRGLPRGARLGRRQSRSRRRSGRSFRPAMRRRSSWPSGSASSGSRDSLYHDEPIAVLKRSAPLSLRKPAIPVIARPRISAWTSCVPS